MSHGVGQHLEPWPIEMQQLAIQLQREIRRPRPVLPVAPIAEALAVMQECEQLDHVFPHPVDLRHRQPDQPNPRPVRNTVDAQPLEPELLP
jgi:hypothetical protein